MRENLDRAMAQAVETLEQWKGRTVRLFHHKDADGLSSGAILSRAMTRAGFDVARTCLEKPYPPVIQTIFRDAARIIIFADFAGRIAPLLARANRGRNLVLILDHHPAVASDDPFVLNLDPHLFGFRGDRDVSASTVCFRFAERLDPANRDLAYLAVTGAVGDGFFQDGRLTGLNRLAAEAAVALGQLEITARPDGEAYRLCGPVHALAVDALAEDLDLLGGMGFFQEGPEAGIRVCLKGYDAAAKRLRDRLTRRRLGLFAAERDALRAGALKFSKGVQWFGVGNRFDGTGVKTIGTFCAQLRGEEFIDPDKYLAGFQPVPNRVPGLGRIDFNAVKVSMRVPPALEARIEKGQMPGLDRLLPEATRAAGGFSDACHSLAAATTIPPGAEKKLIAAMDALLQASCDPGAFLPQYPPLKPRA